MSNKNLPTGTRDEFGGIADAKEAVIRTVQQNFKQRGFQKIITPLLEYQAVFQPLAEQSYQPYQFIDEYGDTLVLRPDMTLPVARVMSSTGIATPTKWYYEGDVFRMKRKLSGSYNQITQAGMEIIGYPSLKAEWECLLIAGEICQQLSMPDLTLELSNAQFVPKVLAALPLDTLRKEALKKALFAKDLTQYVMLIQDLKGDTFYPFLENWPWLFGDFDTTMEQLKKLPELPILQSMIKDLQQTKAFLQQQFDTLTITLDLSVASPQKYYTGMVFKGYSQAANNYLFSGGRYDQLLSSFQQTIQPAVGLAFDIDAIVDQQLLTPQPKKTLIYFAPDQWTEAQALQKKQPNSSLCLVDRLKSAQTIAQQQQAELIDLTER